MEAAARRASTASPTASPTTLYAQKPDPKAIPGFVKRKGEVVIGTVAGLRAVKDLPLLVRAVGGLSGTVRLVIVGEGPERADDPRRRRGDGAGATGW